MQTVRTCARVCVYTEENAPTKFQLISILNQILCFSQGTKKLLCSKEDTIESVQMEHFERRVKKKWCLPIINFEIEHHQPIDGKRPKLSFLLIFLSFFFWGGEWIVLLNILIIYQFNFFGKSLTLLNSSKSYLSQ